METFNAMRRRSTSNLNTDSKDSKGIHLRVNALILGLIGTCFSFLGFPPARAFWFYIYFFGLTWYRTPTTRTHLWIWTLLDIIFDYSSNVNSLPNISGQIECNCSNNGWLSAAFRNADYFLNPSKNPFQAVAITSSAVPGAPGRQFRFVCLCKIKI